MGHKIIKEKIYKNKKGQMILWVIIAIVIVVSVILAFFLKYKDENVNPVFSSPNSFIQKCIAENVIEKVEEILPTGGFVEPEDYKIDGDVKVVYLCKASTNLIGCINQHPSYIEEIRISLLSEITSQIENCFNQLQNEAENRGEKITYGETNNEISLAPGKIFIDIDKRTTITRGDNSNVIESYKIEIDSPLYDLANVAIEIANSEAKYCYFEYVGYMIMHPELNIEKWVFSDNSKRYSIEDKETGSKLNIAITSENCNQGGRI